jgi:hypothetical protein
VKHDAAEELYVVVAFSEGSACGLANQGKSFGHEIVQRLAGGEASLEPLRLAWKLLRRELKCPGLLRIYGMENGKKLLQIPLVLGTEEERDGFLDHAKTVAILARWVKVGLRGDHGR